MDPYAKAIAQMEACRAHAQQQAPLHRQEVQQEAEQVSDLFAATIEPELKKVQFALQSAHYRSRVDVPLRGPSPHSRMATLYAAHADESSTMLQLVYTPEFPGVITAAIFRFKKGLRHKPSNWDDDQLIRLAEINQARIQALCETFIAALGDHVVTL